MQDVIVIQVRPICRDQELTQVIHLLGPFNPFIARRGCPKNVTSDKGKVFLADETQAFCSNKGVSWGFNLAKAPWRGGF